MLDELGTSPSDYPPADDREEDEWPARARNLKALKALWRDRDMLYAKSDKALRDGQIAAVRLYREKEANDDLPVAERARGWALAHSWYPPRHGQGVR